MSTSDVLSNQLDDAMDAFLSKYHMSMDRFIQLIENSHDDCIVSQMLEYIIDLQREVERKDTHVQEILGQLIIRKYQIRQEEEDRIMQSYESKLTELTVVVEELETKLKNIDEESNIKFEILDRYDCSDQA